MEVSNRETSSKQGATVSSLPTKPIVPDLTVSSSKGEDESRETTMRESDCRDDNTRRGGSGEEENREESSQQDQKFVVSKPSPTKIAPCPSNNGGMPAKPPSTSSMGNPSGNRYHYPRGNGMGQQQQPTRGGPFPPMNRGPPGGGPSFGHGPPPYYTGNSSFGGPPPPHMHHGLPPPFHPGGPSHPSHLPHHQFNHHHGHHPMMQPPPFQGGYHPMNQNGSFPPHHPSHGPPPQSYGGGPYGLPPQAFHGMGPAFMSNSSNGNVPASMSTDSNSISSCRSKSSRNSSKKRTIENVVSSNSIPSAYSFRRTDSASSATSTVTAGNNTQAGDVTVGGEGGGKSPKQMPKPEVTNKSNNMKTNESARGSSANTRRGYHRRDYSGTSTASSLSAGGYSLESYEGPRVGATEDPMILGGASSMLGHSPKRLKGADGELLMVDTDIRPDSVSVDADQSSRFEHLSIDADKLPPSTSSSASSAGQDRNLFLSLSTSPINNEEDATPLRKNKNNKDQKMPATKNTTTKNKTSKSDTSAAIVADRPSDTPTPPVQGELGSSMTHDHNMLNQHLRNQSFTPLNHESSGVSPSNMGFASGIQPQLSWDIVGDTPSLGDLADWDVDKLSKTATKEGQKSRPSSTSSSSTRNMMISPHDYQFWKDDMPDSGIAGVGGTTTPLPAFFGQGNGEGIENHQLRFDVKKSGDPNHIHHMFMVNSGGPIIPGPSLKSSKPMPLPVWSKHYDPASVDKMMGMPPTPVFQSGEFREEAFGPRSPMGADRRDMEYYPFPPHMGPHIHNDRVRNLRGRLPHGGHMPPMPIHIPPHMSAHLPMTSPMGLGPKSGIWSPHHMPHMASPGHMGSPMAQSRRKCAPLKPPIPSKFQGDMDKSKSALVPEFTSLVNFPGHMSQKQAVNLPEGMRCCVMCGQACPCSTANKIKKCKKVGGNDGSLAPRSSNTAHDQLGDKNSGYAIIPTQNKGLCTLCDVNVWVVVSSGLEIKWCKGCKNFRPWAAFGDKGLATKCLRCRDRQREKYALQKEEKEKTRPTTTIPSHKMKMSIHK